MSVGILEFGKAGLEGYTLSSRGSAIPDAGDLVTLGRHQGLQRAINAYLSRFLAATPKLVEDGAIGATTVETLNMVYQHGRVGGALARLPTWTVQTAADAAVSTAIEVANAAGTDPDFTAVPKGGSAARPPGRGAVPPPAAASASAAAKKGKSGVIAAALGITAALGIGVWASTRDR